MNMPTTSVGLSKGGVCMKYTFTEHGYEIHYVYNLPYIINKQGQYVFLSKDLCNITGYTSK